MYSSWEVPPTSTSYAFIHRQQFHMSCSAFWVPCWKGTFPHSPYCWYFSISHSYFFQRLEGRSSNYTNIQIQPIVRSERQSSSTDGFNRQKLFVICSTHLKTGFCFSFSSGTRQKGFEQKGIKETSSTSMGTCLVLATHNSVWAVTCCRYSFQC